MSTLNALQKTFKKILLTEVLERAENNEEVSDHAREKLKHYTKNEREARLAIYKNNVHHSLGLALKDLYPSIEKALGEDFFKALSQVFIANNPPETSSLIFFGESFPSFLSIFEHTKSYLYLPDLAWIDFYRHKSYHAEDQDIFDITQASLIEPEELGSSQVVFTDTMNTIHSPWRVFSLWQDMHDSQESDDEISVEGSEDILIYRDSVENAFQIQTFSINKDISFFLTQLKQKANISEALEETINEYAKFEPSSAIAFLFSHPIVHKLI